MTGIYDIYARFFISQTRSSYLTVYFLLSHVFCLILEEAKRDLKHGSSSHFPPLPLSFSLHEGCRAIAASPITRTLLKQLK